MASTSGNAGGEGAVTDAVGAGCGGREPSWAMPVAAATSPVGEPPVPAEPPVMAGPVPPLDAPDAGTPDGDPDAGEVPGTPEGCVNGPTMSTAASTEPGVTEPTGAPPIGAGGSVEPPLEGPVPVKTGAPDGTGPQDQLGVGLALPWASRGWQPVGVMIWPGQTKKPGGME